MENCFRGKVVLVTGGSNGIGAEIVKKFASLGSKVILNYNCNTEAAKIIKCECEEQGGTVFLKQGDVSDEAFVKEMFQAVSQDIGNINYLVNNAGINKDGFLMTSNIKDIDNVISTNLKGTIYCCKYVIPYMINNRQGAIVNISSVSGIKGTIGQTIYGGTKAGIIGLTKALAVEMAKYNIRVNSISPGFINTRMTEKIPSKMKQEYIKAIPVKRFGECSEIADLVEFLLSEKSSYIDGQNIVIDGGLTA